MSKEKIVRQVEDFSNAVQDMRNAMNKTPEAVSERQMKVTSFQKQFPDALYLEPKHRIPTKGVRNSEKDKNKDYLHEYVVGIFESQLVGSKLTLWKDGLPGDDFCMWEIPVNRPVGIPRFLAQHLSKELKWKEMLPLGRNNEPQAVYDEEMMKPFERFVEKRRGTFHPINSY